MAERKSERDIIRKIKQALKQLGIPLSVEAPKPIPGCEVLLGKIVVVVNDNAELLALIVAHFMVATDGNTKFVLHKEGQTLKQLAGRILRKTPDIVLVDGKLAGGLEGPELVSLLKKRNPTLLCIGFSAGEEMRKKFIEQGVKEFVLKDAGEPERTIRNLAALLNK